MLYIMPSSKRSKRTSNSKTYLHSVKSTPGKITKRKQKLSKFTKTSNHITRKLQNKRKLPNISIARKVSRRNKMRTRRNKMRTGNYSRAVNKRAAEARAAEARAAHERAAEARAAQERSAQARATEARAAEERERADQQSRWVSAHPWHLEKIHELTNANIPSDGNKNQQNQVVGEAYNEKLNNTNPKHKTNIKAHRNIGNRFLKRGRGTRVIGTVGRRNIWGASPNEPTNNSDWGGSTGTTTPQVYLHHRAAAEAAHIKLI